MPQSNLGIQIKLDTGQAKGQADDLSRAISDLNKQLKEAAEPKDWKSVAQLAQKINDASSARMKVMEMSRQAQGGVSGQNITIDTSQAIRNVEELDNVIVTFNRHLSAARDAMDFKSTAQLEKIIDTTSSARLKAMEQGRVQEKPDPDSLIQQAETTGDWKNAAQNLSRMSRYQPAPESMDIDTSQAVSSIKELESNIAEYQKTLREARENNGWKSDGQFEKIIEETETARTKVMEMSRQAQGGVSGQSITIDTSQAIRNVEELDNVIVTFNRHLSAARDAMDFKSTAQLEKIIDTTSSARLKAMEQGRVQEKPDPDSLIQQAETTGDWKNAAQNLSRMSRYQPAPESMDIDTSQAVSSIKELESNIAEYQKTLREARENNGWKSDGQFEKIIEETETARTKVMEMSRQAQGGVSGQSITIDTSQAIRNVEELDAVILSFQEHLQAAKQNDESESIGYIVNAIENTSSARSAIMEQGHIQQAQAPDDGIRQTQTTDDIIGRAEKTGEWKSAAVSISNSEQTNRYNNIPANPQTNQFLQTGIPKNSDINRRIIIDASQAKTQVDELSRLIVTLNEELAKATEEKDWKSVAVLTKAIDSASSGRGTIAQQARQSQAQEQAQQAREGVFGGQGMWVLQQSLNQITHGILSAWDAALTAAKQRASGDYTGAAVTQNRATGEAWGQGLGTAAGVGIGALLMPLLGPMAIPLAAGLVGEIGKFLGGIDAKKMEENLAYSAQYKNALPGIDTLNQLYGGAINQKPEEENNQHGLDLRGTATGAARGTGLDTERFIEATGQTATYGIQDATQAMNMTRTQALWSRFTGADMGTIQKFAGQAYRYGGERDAASVAYGGLKAQDMGKGQFSEFMHSIERAMSEGISKGFVKSTEEIAGNMQMLYKLSGDSALWQGEQGAQRLSQMNMAISSATNLQSVEDVISYSAARDLLGSGADRNAKFLNLTGGNISEGNANFRATADGGNNIMGSVRQGQRVEILGNEGDYFRVNNGGREGYVHKTMFNNSGNIYTGTYADVMQILERGLSADLLKGQWSAVRQLDGDNNAATIERFKEMYGLNYTGASQVWGMYQNAWDESLNDGKGGWKEGFSAEQYETQIKKLQETPGYQSDSQKLQDILNDLRTNGIKAGKFEFNNTEIVLLRQEAEKLVEILRGKQAGSSIAAAGERMEDILYTDETIETINDTVNPYGGGAGARFMLNMGDLEHIPK